MSATTDTPKNIHQGRNVKRFREMLGLKQEALALELGDDWSQKRISLLESKEVIEPEVLTQIAKALKVPEEAIKNFDEEKAIYNIQNNYEGSILNHSSNYQFNNNCTFNPIEKIVSLYDEKVALLERLLESEKEKVELLKKING
jgi:transcriptional regulator with XRE-family HTH domain